MSIIFVLYHRGGVYCVKVTSASPCVLWDHLSLGSCCPQTFCPSERHSDSPGTENGKTDAGNGMSWGLVPPSHKHSTSWDSNLMSGTSMEICSGVLDWISLRFEITAAEHRLTEDPAMWKHLETARQTRSQIKTWTDQKISFHILNSLSCPGFWF